MNIRPKLGALLLGSLYIIVLHIVLALALDIALGAMLPIIFVMALGIARLGGFLAAVGIADALGDPIDHPCSTCQIILEVKSDIHNNKGTLESNHND